MTKHKAPAIWVTFLWNGQDRFLAEAEKQAALAWRAGLNAGTLIETFIPFGEPELDREGRKLATFTFYSR